MKSGHFIANILARLVGRVGSIGANIIAVAIMARSMDPTDFGHVMFLFTLIAIFVQVADFGTTNVMARMVVDHVDSPNAFWPSFLGVRAVLSVIAMALAVSYALLSGAKAPWPWLVIAVLSIPFVAARFFDAAFQVFGRTWAIAWSYMLYGVILIALTSAAAWQHAGGAAFMAANFAASAAYCVAAAFFLRGIVRWNVSGNRQLRRDILTMAIPLGIGALFTTINSRASVMIVEYYRGAVEVGLFAAALRVLDLAIAGAMIALGPLLPSFVVAAQDPPRLRRMYCDIVRLLLVVMVPVVVTAPIWSGPLVHLIYGEKYLSAAPALALIIIVGALALFNLLNSYVLLARQVVKFAAWITGAAAAIGIALNLWLVPLYGYMAAASVSIAMEALMLTATFVLLRRELGQIFEARTWWLMVLATVGLAVPLYVYAAIGPWWGLVGGSLIYGLVIGKSGLWRFSRSAWAS